MMIEVTEETQTIRPYLSRILVAIPEEPLATISTSQFANDLLDCLVDDVRAFNGKRWKANHGQECSIDFLGHGLPGQHGLKHSSALLDFISHDVDHGVITSAGSEEVEFVHGFKGSFSHANGARVQLHYARVGLVSPLPDAVVRDAIGRLDEKDQVLHKSHLVQGEDALQSGCSDLSQEEQVERNGVDLQMAPFGVSVNLINLSLAKCQLFDQDSNILATLWWTKTWRGSSRLEQRSL